MEKILDTAYTIALVNLRNRYGSGGISAGSTHFSELWTRDSSFASWGCLAVGDVQMVKGNLALLLKHTSPAGHVPLRLGQKHFWLRYLGFNGNTYPRFKEDKYVSEATDSNSLLMISFAEYIKKTQDKSFALYHLSKLQSIIDWNFSTDKDGDLLMEEGPYAGWADSLKKNGHVLYTNILHCKAVQAFSEICDFLGANQKKKHYVEQAAKIKHRINTVFWNGRYYSDWVNHQRRDYFSTDGNLLAILFDIASLGQAARIQHFIHYVGLDKGFCIGTNYPKYDNKHVFPLFFMIHLHDYHNGLQWLWLGCLDAVVKHRMGLKKEAIETLEKLAEKIIEYNGIYEVYHEGKPVKRTFYKSETGFAWSSGLFIWACRQVAEATLPTSEEVKS